jgi:hypothetical protein
MRVIPVDVYPLKRAYDSFAAAIIGAERHPFQPKARADTAKLAGAVVVDACWTDTDFIVRFSNGLYLQVFAEREQIRWEVTDAPPNLSEFDVERVGASVVTCRWRTGVGDSTMDRSALVAKRRRSQFERLFVNEGGLLMYCRAQPIWWFHVIRRTDLDQPFLFVTEDE